MSGEQVIVLVVLGIALAGLAVFKAFGTLGRRHKPSAKNNWTNEAHTNREVYKTWEKDG